MRLSTLVFMAILAAGWEAELSRVRADDAPVDAASAQYEDTLQRALQEFALEHWVEAKILFTRANALRPNARVLRGLGLVCYELRQYVQAIEYFEAALLSSVQPLTAEMTQDVHTFLARSRDFVSQVKLEVQPSSAEIRIDGGPAPRVAADGTFLLDPGPHELVIAAAGFEQQSRTLFAEGGKQSSLSLVLNPLRANDETRATPNSSTPPAPVRVDPAPPASRLGPWLAIGISGAVAVAGGVMLGVATVDKHRVENPDPSPTWSDYEDSYDTASALFPVGAVMLGVGVAGVAAGLIWNFSITPESSDSAVALRLAPGYLGVSGRL